ncbi:hypothetical protein GPECTOR_125g501 [Gonium pectorale]|uniref:Uncharacterized protein n=1 Tax=Gonium pectorale TaxID=33097 RepID=A0A150FYK7_GONPE|nr:hypothetical protein GPECTOR_125g501 [Gonium pectorale]|eukprot:KXZ42668.1 hypothetical protein GPECTOR_125g501 [Gonium pectorale]
MYPQLPVLTACPCRLSFPFSLPGVLWGVRVLKYGGQMVFKDPQNNLTAVVDVDPQPQAGFLTGWFRAKKPTHKPDQVVGKLLRGDAVLDTCHGSWLHCLEWDKGLSGPPPPGAPPASPAGRRLWDIRATPLTPAAPLAAPLPSDCRHREDVVFLARGDQIQSQEWKHTLEERQRKDRKLRHEGGGYEH